MKQQTMNLTIALFVIALLSIWTGCEETPQNPTDEPNDEEQVNPNIPNANGLIAHQRLIGDSDKKSSVWEIIDSGDGGFYFRGYYHDEYALGKLDQTGQQGWVFSSSSRVRDFILISEFSGDLGNSVLIAGGIDSNFDDEVDIGYVSLFNSTGSLIDELTLSNDTTTVWLNALAVSEASDSLYHLVAVGGAEMSGSYYSYVVRLTVASDSTIRKAEEKIFTARPANAFRNIQIDLEQTPRPCYTQGDEYSKGTGYGDQIVCRLSDELDISWSQDIVPQAGFQSWTYSGKGFLYSSDNLFMTGVTEVDKEVNPSNGGYWDAGVVARLSTGGSVDWVKTIILSQYTERFNSCCLSDGVLYVAGRCSSFIKTESRNVFSNALLLKVDPETGHVITNLSFGSEYYRSHFNDVIVRGTQAFAVGYTNYEVENGPYQGWFVVIDVSGSSLVTEISKPVMDRTMDRDAGNTLNNLEETGCCSRN